MSINSIPKPHILFNTFNLRNYSNICKKPIESIKVCYLGKDSVFLNHFKNLNIDSIDISKEISVIADKIKYDFITIHIPKSDDNISFFDREKLSWVQDNSVLINAARGAIVDEDTLFTELQKRRIKAAFDVYWQESYNGKLKEFYPDHFFMTSYVASTCTGLLEGCREGLDALILELSK